MPGPAKTIRMPEIRNVSNSNGLFRKHKKKRVETKKREQHLIVYVPIKRPTGDRAEMKEDENYEMWFKVVEEARKEMLLSGFKKLSIPSPLILDYRRRGRYMSRAASLILFMNV